jgi:outer membrane scaffolding protein for murein synthesis (MipA/OmpV family)
MVLAAIAGAAACEPITVFGYDLNPSLRAEAAPSYEGGKRYSVFPGGSLAITRPWDFDAFSAPDDAATFALYNSKRFAIGVAASLKVNRGNSDELQGMRNIGWSLQGGGYVDWWPTDHLRAHAEVLRGLTAQDGLLVNTGLDYVIHTRKWNLSGGPRFSWADDKFNDTYFSVTPLEAAASPYIDRAYTAKAGPHYAGVEASAEYKLFPRWRLTVDGSYHRLLSDDAASPLVRQLGKVDQLSAAVGVRFLLAD